MNSDDKDNQLLDWRALCAAARERQASGGDRQDRADRGKRRQKTARLLAFPFARRTGLIRKLAQQMFARAPVDAERHLVTELQRHRAVLRRRQFSDSAITVQLRALEGAVRAELWRLVLMVDRGDKSGDGA